MPTLPEAIVTHQSELRILAASFVSNHSPEAGQQEKTTIESVIKTIEESSEKLFDVLEDLIKVVI
ncbi:MAG: hypothetical protein IT267_02455 [Saprospiraceae bacterium]|nr:hypothetical protein [Saprospiraceae bacterium]